MNTFVLEVTLSSVRLAIEDCAGVVVEYFHELPPQLPGFELDPLDRAVLAVGKLPVIDQWWGTWLLGSLEEGGWFDEPDAQGMIARYTIDAFPKGLH